MGPRNGEEQKSVATRQIGFVTSKHTRLDAGHVDGTCAVVQFGLLVLDGTSQTDVFLATARITVQKSNEMKCEEAGRNACRNTYRH